MSGRNLKERLEILHASHVRLTIERDRRNDRAWKRHRRFMREQEKAWEQYKTARREAIRSR